MKREEKFFQPFGFMDLDEKSFQKTLVAIAKDRNVRNLLNAIYPLLTLHGDSTVMQSKAKFAINLSATILVQGLVPQNELQEYHQLICALIERFPTLGLIENVNFALVKTKMMIGDMRAAFDIARKSQDARLRNFSVIFEGCAQERDPDSAKEILAEVLRRGLVPTETDYGNILKSFRRMQEAEMHTEIDALMQTISENYDILLLGNIEQALESVLPTERVTMSVSINADRDSFTCGRCPISGILLDLIDLTDSEMDEMRQMTKRLSSEATQLKQTGDTNAELNFESYIASALPGDMMPDIILDAANIAHINQNYEGGFFRFDQIDDILSHFRDRGHKCLVVIHEKWTSPDRDLTLFYPPRMDSSSGKKKPRKIALPQLGETLVEGRPVIFDEHLNPATEEEKEKHREIFHPVPIDMIERWRANKEVLIVPHGQNDDWFWMHICLLSMKRNPGKEILLVSNDQMRDHFWRMKNPKFFNKFRTNHICQYSIQFGEDKINHYSFKLPGKFSVTMQRHVSDQGEIIWHIPYKRPDNEVKWLILKLD